MNYREALTAAMSALAADPRVIFMGQAVARPGTFMSQTFAGVRPDRLIELPVAEEMQMGMATGLAVAGLVPVTVFPRWNFLLLAMNQLIGHLDKIPLYSSYRPRVIVRVGVGPSGPLDPGVQHVGDFSEPVAAMCSTLTVVRLTPPVDVVGAYLAALAREGSTVLVEYGDAYDAEA